MNFRQSSQPFCGFEADDVKKSIKRLSNVKDDNTHDDSEVEGSHSEGTNDSQPLENHSQEQTIESDTNDASFNDEKLIIVTEILDKVVDIAMCGDGPADAIDQNSNVATECIRVLKDDPETLLFLSYS